METPWFEKTGKKYALGIVHKESVPMSWALSLRLTTLPSDCAILAQCHYGVDMARNNIVELAIKGGVDRILWLDSDVCPQPDAIMKLLNSPEPFISGVYYAKRDFDENKICAWAYEEENGAYVTIVDEHDDSKVIVDAVGFGLVATDVDLFKKLKPPWFKYESETYDKDGKKQKGVSEDFYFCRRAVNELGIHPVLDYGSRGSHLGSAEYTPHGKVIKPQLAPQSQIERFKTMEEITDERS